MKDLIEGIYVFIGGLISFIVFVGSWIYCISEYGYLLGVGLGWLPSMIVAFLAYILWLPALIILFAIFYYSH